MDRRRALGTRNPRRYDDVADAVARMHAKNPHLSAELAHHLTVHGLSRDADGRYGWKFDPIIRAWPPVAAADEELQALWHDIACPVLLCHGSDSWASNPAEDGRAGFFRDARVVSFAGAGHWMHHDRHEAFMAEVKDFLAD